MIRFMFVTLYFLFMLPGMFAIRRFRGGAESDLFTTMSIAILLLYFLAELFEFLVLRYRKDHRIAMWLLFLLRITAVAVYWAVFPRGEIPVRHNPVVSAMTPLIVFYAYFLFQQGWSIAIMIAAILPIPYDYIFRNEPRDIPGPDQLGFVLFRMVVMIFFYLLAWFWDTERIRNAENRRLVAELHSSHEKLRQYARELGRSVALEERTRLAREIHDSVGHALTALGIQLSKALAYLDVDPAEARQAVTAAHTTAEDAMRDIRASIGGLNGDTSGIEFEEKLRELAIRLKETGLTVAHSVAGTESRYNYAVLLGLYRFIQEGTTNILKHAQAHHVEITVNLGESEGMARIRDDGVGFDPALLERREMEEHTGLRGLVRRIELIGGTMEMTTGPEGTILTARVPRDPLVLAGQHDETTTRPDR